MSQLKKWISSQLWQTFMNDYNENIDNLNGLLYANNAGSHNSIYRGKYLGSSVTEAQKTAISAGTFDDMYIGDYWTIGGVNYRIAAFNYYLNTGDTQLTTNHITLVPDTGLYNAKMNDTDITDGGYAGSLMHTTNLADAKTTINTAFSGLVLNHRKYLSNTIDAQGRASAGSWYDSTVELMTEPMLYGCVMNGRATFQSFNVGAEKTQLPLFALSPEALDSQYAHFWLRDIVDAKRFAIRQIEGLPAYTSANYTSARVRPVFSIKGS